VIVLSVLKFLDRDGRTVGNNIPAPKIEGLPVRTVNFVLCTLDLYESQVTVDAQSGKLTQFNELVSEQAAGSLGYDIPWTGPDHLKHIADLVSIHIFIFQSAHYAQWGMMFQDSPESPEVSPLVSCDMVGNCTPGGFTIMEE
jgi:hypothetical protein